MNFLPPVRNWQRWREVQAVLLRYGFDLLIDQEEIQEVRRLLREKLHVTIGEFSERSLPERVRMMLQDLGPTAVKLGQILSSRSDFLPADWVSELSSLQDAVPPFPFEQVREIIQGDLHRSLEELFLEFDPEPIAAASIGQVHRAVLPNLNRVVVKVQRPGIAPQVHADMEILRELARLLEDRTAWGRQYGVTAIIDEFARSMNFEMDYENEATNADRLRRNMASQPGVHVPYIYWELVTPHILTMEEVQGIKATDLARLDEAGVNRVQVADVFIHSIFHQILIDGFFQADPHPGNLMIEPGDGTLVYIDLGMMGSLLPEQRQQFGDLVQAVLRRDSREVVRRVLVIGTPYKPVRESSLRREVDHIINRYLEASLDRFSFSMLLREVLTVIFREGVRLPSDLTLAIKTLIQGEEVARTLDPRIQIVDILQSISQQILLQNLDPRNWVYQLGGSLREALRLMEALPRATETLLKQIEAGALRVGLDIPDFRQQVDHLYTISNRMTAGLIIAGMIIGSSIAMSVSPDHSWSFIPVLGVVGFVLSMTIGLALVWSVFMDLWRVSRHKENGRH